MSQDNLELVRNAVAQQLNDEKIKLETMEKSFSLLTDFIFQTMTTAKSQGTNEERLETVSNGMQEIKKYAEQEIQRKFVQTVLKGEEFCVMLCMKTQRKCFLKIYRGKTWIYGSSAGYYAKGGVRECRPIKECVFPE